MVDTMLFVSMITFRDSLPGEAMKQVSKEFGEQQKHQREEKQKTAEKDGKQLSKLVEKIPGWISMFFRGVNLIQDVSGALGVTVPMASIFLRAALPLVRPPLVPMPLATYGELEAAVFGKLKEFQSAGLVLGAQVAMLADGQDGWECNVALGCTGLTARSVTETTLIPLLDAGVGPLLVAFLAAISKPTSTGKDVSLSSTVGRLWPEFSRNGKGAVTIQQALSHAGGLQKPFPSKTNFKSFLGEAFLEEAVSGCVHEAGGPSGVCRVIGVLLGALLRRATGHKTAKESLRSMLEPLDLEDEIVFHADDPEMMGFAAHKLLESVTVATIWELLEARLELQKREQVDPLQGPPWWSWRELLRDHPWVGDPLLVNYPPLREGKSFVVGRGLRASAKALCRLYSAGTILPEVLQQSLADGRRLCVDSLEEWHELGRCLEVAAGWQLLRFRRLADGEEVVGYGHFDAATGSVALRLEGSSIAVLLTCVDEDARQVGHEVLSLLARSKGLEPLWHLDKPKAPEKPPSLESTAKEKEKGLQETLDTLVNQVSRLTELVEGRQCAVGDNQQRALPSELEGTWTSAETEGMEELLEALNVPAMARSLARKMKRTLVLRVNGDDVEMNSTMSIAGRQMDSTSLKFVIGQPFEGVHMQGKPFRGAARWCVPEGAASSPEQRALVLEKHFEVKGHEVATTERFFSTADGRVHVETTLKGRGAVEVHVGSEEDRQALCHVCDPETLLVRRELVLGGGQQVVRAGRLPYPLAELASLPLPGTVTLHYSDISSTTIFDREGGNRPRAAAGGAAPSVRAPTGAPQRESLRPSPQSAPLSCFAGMARGLCCR